ncbi:hypothetical protein HUU05_26520 [candidate division KSB1 bacterium]|nr:hypothetical protein [candidate division KSB1 bacterium]
MREFDFVVEMNPFDRYRQRHLSIKGKIIKFTAQYETNIGGQWLPVVRYDTAHGFFHRDVMHPNKRREKISIEAADFNEALTFAREDIKRSWQNYKAAFIKEMNRYEN